MILTKQKSVILLLLLCVQVSHSIVLPSTDTLKILITGTTKSRPAAPLGFKITDHGGVRFSARRTLKTDMDVYLVFNAKSTTFIPFTEEGRIRWQQNGMRVTGGMFRSRYGRTRFYRSVSVYNPMFENYVLWDAIGIGTALEKESGKSLIKGAVTMDQDKCSASHLLYRVKHKRFTGLVLSGIHLAPSEIRNDRFTAGSELFLYYRKIKLHAVMAYDYIKHFGIPVNKTTNKLAHLSCGFIEARVHAAKFLDINMLTYYKKYQRNDDYQFTYSGYVVESIFINWFGIGQGIETEAKNDKTIIQPEIFFLLTPIKDHVSLKLSCNIGRKDEISRPYKWSGSIRIAF